MVVQRKARVPKGPVTKIWKPEQRCFELPRDLTRASQMGGGSTSEDLTRWNASVQSAINRAVHREGAAARIQDNFLIRNGRYRGSTSPTSCANQLLEHHATVIRATRMADPSVTGLEARKTWWWVKLHAIPVARYLGVAQRFSGRSLRPRTWGS